MSDRAGVAFRRLFSAVLTSACCLIAFAASEGDRAAADSSASAPARVPTVTRLVKTFDELESRVDEAARTHDAAALDRLLGPDFELRSSVRPGVPLPRAEFIAQMLAKANEPARIEQMAVHDLGSTAIVSFAMRYGAGAANVFVVDVWSQAGGEWRLQIRYAGPGGIQAQPSEASAPSDSDTLPKKY
jgi:hypothetical protein